MPGSSPMCGLSVPPAMLKPNPELPCGHGKQSTGWKHSHSQIDTHQRRWAQEWSQCRCLENHRHCSRHCFHCTSAALTQRQGRSQFDGHRVLFQTSSRIDIVCQTELTRSPTNAAKLHWPACGFYISTECFERCDYPTPGSHPSASVSVFSSYVFQYLTFKRPSGPNGSLMCPNVRIRCQVFLLEFVLASRLADGVTRKSDAETQQGDDDSQMFHSCILSAVQMKFP